VTQGTQSSCFDECANDWPPLRVSSRPTVAGGASASIVGTTKRSDGRPEATYKGHPLYLFEGDHRAGDVNGQGVTAFGGAWYALSPSGDPVTLKPAAGGGY
jgi:predicted lipoprotein with Yx(FWY)xxD motif